MICNRCEHNKEKQDLLKKFLLVDISIQELRQNICFGCKYLFEQDHFNQALKKCPFCGSTASVRMHDRGDYPGDDYSVCCNNSECEIETGLYETREEAIAAWNRRA